MRRELPAVLVVFILEKAGPDAERQLSPADHIDARRDLGEMRGITITNRRRQGGESDAVGDGGETHQPSRTGSSGAAHAGDLDHVIQDREPDKTVVFRLLRLRLHHLECLDRIVSVEPGRVVNAERHVQRLLFCSD
jgi:hypothetical protein